MNKSSNVPYPGKPEKVIIKHNVVNPEIVLRDRPGIFSCLLPHAEYLKLQTLTVDYKTYLPGYDIGTLGISILDSRLETQNEVIKGSIEANSDYHGNATGFQMVRTVSGCPYHMLITPDVHNIEPGTDIGEIIVKPSFLTGNRILNKKGFPRLIGKMDEGLSHQGIEITYE